MKLKHVQAQLSTIESDVILAKLAADEMAAALQQLAAFMQEPQTFDVRAHVHELAKAQREFAAGTRNLLARVELLRKRVAA